MLKNIVKKGLYLGAMVSFLGFVVSCEEDFTDIGTSIVDNNKFNTFDTVFDVEISSFPIQNVRAGGLNLSSGNLGQYLLGVFNHPNYEKIEASIISQLRTPIISVVNEDSYDEKVNVITTVDTVYVKLPYHSTSTIRSGSVDLFDYTLDSIIGNKDVPFTLNVYRSDSFLNQLNPQDPTKQNEFYSDQDYVKLESLNHTANYQFVPNVHDTAMVVSRRLNDGKLYDTDTIVIGNRAPFARIPLDKRKIQQIFVDNYQTSDFETQEAFNDYFRGLIIEATGNDGSLLAFNFNNTDATFNPALEIFYTNTVYSSATNAVLDTIKGSDSFALGGIATSQYKMSGAPTNNFNNFVVQGAAGTNAEVKLFGSTDSNNNGIADQIEIIRLEDWLINDASLFFYVDQDVVQYDTINTPYRLYLHKSFTEKGTTTSTQVKDALSEGPVTFGGNLTVSNKKPDSYRFRITDYISDLLNAKSDNNSTLMLKVFNNSDLPTTLVDTVMRNYSWNPKAVSLLNHLQSNGTRRAQLKISYSRRKEAN